ncbi:hypothetical protein [Paenibacillus albus]|uniref:hypothetical protein n=1 Tax=Paenibacillus albus TaxID=2495582 RepID=UPI0013DFC7DD|nr:hypothetical protein [Paenibacillus albus]
MEHVQNEAAARGYGAVYLSTMLDGYYERYDWVYEGNGYYMDGSETKIYKKCL